MLDKDGSGVVTFSEFKAGILQGEGFVHGAGQQHGVCRQTAVLLLSLVVSLAGIVLISNVFISLTDTSLRSQYGQILGSAVTLASYEAESRLQDMEQIAHAEAGIWARGMFAPWTPSAVSVAAAAAAAAAAANGGATPAPHNTTYDQHGGFTERSFHEHAVSLLRLGKLEGFYVLLPDGGVVGACQAQDQDHIEFVFRAPSSATTDCIERSRVTPIAGDSWVPKFKWERRGCLGDDGVKNSSTGGGNVAVDLRDTQWYTRAAKSSMLPASYTSVREGLPPPIPRRTTWLPMDPDPVCNTRVYGAAAPVFLPQGRGAASGSSVGDAAAVGVIVVTRTAAALVSGLNVTRDKSFAEMAMGFGITTTSHGMPHLYVERKRERTINE